MTKKEHKPINWKRWIGILLFLSLLFSIGYAIVRFANAPSVDEAVGDELQRSDYLLMLLQCVLGLIVMFLPSFVNKKLSIDIPNYMYILYFVFLYGAIYLGEVRQFYYLVPHWDSYLHAFSGAMLGALGFSLVSILNDNKSIAVHLSPKFIALFAFCFALAAGAVWEIYEFSGDALLGLNMQKYRLADGSLLVGHAALTDTMKDLIIDALSALVVTIIGYLGLKGKGRGRVRRAILDLGPEDSDNAQALSDLPQDSSIQAQRGSVQTDAQKNDGHDGPSGNSLPQS